MIKNLMFDLGGVIMDIEKQRCVDAFDALGLRDAYSYFGDFKQEGIFAAIESGSITVEEFHHRLHELIERPVTDEQIDAAFTRFLIGIPVRRLEELRALHSRYKLYMLSNTNPIMWNGFIRRAFEQEGMEMKNYFDGVITSFEARVMKPDARIFNMAAQKFHIEPEETVFLDDSEANCEAARTLGWHALHVAPGREFMDILREHKLAV